MQLIDDRRRPSTITDDQTGDPGFRTSETCDFDGDLPIIQETNRMICDLLGLPSAHGEPLQGQRYARGQEFKRHTDFFEPGGDEWRRRQHTVGQRTWTAMAYLNEPEAGGATRFSAIKKSIQPEAGMILAWNNLNVDGSPNAATLHQGMPVRAGTKYVLTKWFTEKPAG
ncbi:MAG: 2OG-Fe(II) oxygenase [Pacificimonas sp.]|nr:2OG-Fe(II) oxygenase [Pacificimonas sp.]